MARLGQISPELLGDAPTADTDYISEGSGDEQAQVLQAECSVYLEQQQEPSVVCQPQHDNQDGVTTASHDLLEIIKNLQAEVNANKMLLLQFRTEAGKNMTRQAASHSNASNIQRDGIASNDDASNVDMRIEYHRVRKREELSHKALSSTVIESNDQLTVLLEYIKVEVEALEKAQLSEVGNRDKRERDGKETKITRAAGNATAVGLYAVEQAKQKQCIFCKRTNHDTKECKDKTVGIELRKKILRSKGSCFSGRHITAMCDGKANQKQGGEQEQHTETATLSTMVHRVNNEIYLQTAKAVLISGEIKVLSRIIMDNGSQCTYVTERLAKHLKLPVVGTERTRIVAFGQTDKQSRATQFKRTIINVKSQYSDETVEIYATIVPNICEDVLPVPRLNKQSNKNMAESIVAQEKLIPGINLLIGQDNYWKFNNNNRELLAGNLVAVETFFGWTIQGHYGEGQGESRCVLNILEHREAFDIEQFWNLESIGISSYSEPQAAVQAAEIRHIDGRYSVLLPWKLPKDNLHDNKQNAKNRLSSLGNKLLKNSDKLEEYDAGIRELLSSGVAEAAPVLGETQKAYYMPHHPVYRLDKATTKVRIVFDASASEHGASSLNDHLSPGINLLTDLTAVLIRFRCHRIAIVADIEKAFLQISIDESDRDYHRFFWYASVASIGTLYPKIAEYRMTRVTFGVTCSPFLLTSTIQQHLQMQDPAHAAICQKLQDSFYVDDLVTSVATLRDAEDLYYQSKIIMQGASFNLRKWNSNDAELKRKFKETDVNLARVQKVLGVQWDTITDELSVDIKPIITYVQSLRPTKRNVLRAMARIYDPLGILGPFTINIKILLQKIWKEHLEWDATLSTRLSDEFMAWREDMALLEDFSLQRCMVSGNMADLELHIFADASPAAYGAVAYLREVGMNGEIQIKFVCSKNRVSPIKESSGATLPKLELTAAVVASRLAQYLKKELKLGVSSTYMWSDSSIVLNWISGCGQPMSSIKSKVAEINKLTNIYEWRHCQGNCNPADLLTRGITAKRLLGSELWKRGPKWLELTIHEWPTINTILNCRRQLIKNVLGRCVVCRRLHGKSASEPWTTLPTNRLTTSKAFETTGLDFAGPLYIATEEGPSNRKVYIMLFTCAAIRGVHLELVADMTVESCIGALRKFVARRGPVKTIISDNAKTFKRASLELQKLEKLMENSKIQQYAANGGINWQFIPERAAWWGGFWERLVRTVKGCLRAAIGKASLSKTNLEILLTEVECVVNQRPLTYITTDSNDLEPLTPAHFMGEAKLLGGEGFTTDGSNLAQMWRHRTNLMQRYIKRQNRVEA
ncbi:uncharacterized protein LOC115633562 [Scaptodrosophila lebanonensis]|uniref:Uncharacterized protein LOC115633562 n=1 Tax=Drosophila lebanonensis TaxID=7225 RepID=A0A6J2UHF0_DROLE|nr:uncharacterized protein LOC115633562 [Scaptodrosophila lebanonensis]